MWTFIVQHIRPQIGIHEWFSEWFSVYPPNVKDITVANEVRRLFVELRRIPLLVLLTSYIWWGPCSDVATVLCSCNDSNVMCTLCESLTSRLTRRCSETWHKSSHNSQNVVVFFWIWMVERWKPTQVENDRNLLLRWDGIRMFYHIGIKTLPLWSICICESAS